MLPDLGIAYTHIDMDENPVNRERFLKGIDQCLEQSAPTLASFLDQYGKLSRAKTVDWRHMTYRSRNSLGKLNEHLIDHRLAERSIQLPAVLQIDDCQKLTHTAIDIKPA